MTGNPDVLRRYMAALAAHDVATIASTVADDVVFVSANSELDKPKFLAMLRALYAGFPDWSYEHDPPEVRDDGSIAVRWRQGGTHTGLLAIPGLAEVAATGKRVRIPPQHFFYKVTGRQIVEIRPEPIRGGAPWGILEQIGAANTVL